MAADIGNIRVLMGPPEVGGPDDLESEVVDFIAGARAELAVAVQELEAESIARALVEARRNGVRCRVILERIYLGLDVPPLDPFVAGGANDENRRLLSVLLRAGVDVSIDLNPRTFHQKFIVRDPEGPSSRAAVLTGSTKFTPTGFHRNLNHLVVVRGRRTAGVYQEEFDEMWSGTFGELRERHDPKPREYRPSGVRVKVLFAPEHAPEMEIMKQMLKAERRIDFAMFTFTDTSGIDDTMRAMASSGIAVRGIMDRGQGNQSWAASHGLKNHPNIDIFLSNNGGPLNKLHHKLAVIDDQVIIAGSFNFTLPATHLNDENIVVIGNNHEDDPDSVLAQEALAIFARLEIDHMIDQWGIPA